MREYYRVIENKKLLIFYLIVYYYCYMDNLKHANGFIYNHTKLKYLELFIHNNISHVINNIEKTAKNSGYKVSKTESNLNYGLVRIRIFYTDQEKAKELYKIFDESNIQNIQYYETIKTIKAILKNAFRN